MPHMLNCHDVEPSLGSQIDRASVWHCGTRLHSVALGRLLGRRFAIEHVGAFDAINENAIPAHVVVVLDVRDGPWSSRVVDAVELCRRANPLLPLVPLIPWVPAAIPILQALVRAGSDDAIVDDGRTVTASAFQEHVSACRTRRVDAFIDRHISTTGDVLVRRIVSFCFRNPNRSFGPAAVAALLGLSRSALTHKLARRGLPPLEAVVGHTRCVYAAHLIVHRQYSCEAVAYGLGYGSGSELTKLFQRWCEISPGELRKDGRYDGLLRDFAALLSKRPRRRGVT